MNYFSSLCIYSIPPSFVLKACQFSCLNFFQHPVFSYTQSLLGLERIASFIWSLATGLLINFVYCLFQYILSLRKRILKNKMLSVFLSTAAILALAHIHYFQLLIKYLNSFCSVGQNIVFSYCQLSSRLVMY